MLRPRWRPCRGFQPSARAASWGCRLRFRVMAAFVRCHRTKTPCGRLATEAEKSDGVTDGGPRGENATDGATSRRHVRMMLGQRFAIFMHIRARILCSSGLSSCPCHDLGRETEKRCECPAWKSQSNVGLEAACLRGNGLRVALNCQSVPAIEVDTCQCATNESDPIQVMDNVKSNWPGICSNKVLPNECSMPPMYYHGVAKGRDANV